MDENLTKYVNALIDKANNNIKNVEKFLKSYITYKKKITHNLADLVQLCIKYGKTFKCIIEKA